jgi:hypothetical protein
MCNYMFFVLKQISATGNVLFCNIRLSKALSLAVNAN